MKEVKRKDIISLTIATVIALATVILPGVLPALSLPPSPPAKPFQLGMAGIYTCPDQPNQFIILEAKNGTWARYENEKIINLGYWQQKEEILLLGHIRGYIGYQYLGYVTEHNVTAGGNAFLMQENGKSLLWRKV
jgi:hypothetical protein